MKKELIYILKRVIIGVFIAVILYSIKSCQVKALTNSVVGSNVEFPLSGATFLSMNSNTTYTTRGYRYFYGSTLNPSLYMATPTGSSLTCGTYGCGISLDGLSVLNNNYYAITIYLLGDSTPNWHYSYSNVNTKVGVSNGTSSINSNNWVNIVSGTTGLNKICDSYFDNEYTGNCLFKWTIIFKAPINGTSVQTWWSSNPSGADPMDNGFFVGYTLDYIGDSSLTPEQLNSALNTMTTNITTSINNNINTNTQNIINNQNNNTNSIINNIISNTQQLIDSNKVCNNYDKNYIELDNKYLKNDGTLGDSNDFGVSSYINIEGATIIPFTILQNIGANYCFYNVNKTLISCYSSNSMVANTSLSYPNNASFLRFTVRKLDNRPQLEICKNGSQAINESINQVNDTLTDETPPNLSSLNNSAGWLPAGPVDSILNLPLALLNNINTNLSKTCQPVILHIPLVDRDLPIPCITTLYEQMGIMTWVNTIGAIASAFILFSYFVKLYKWVDDTLTFRENNYLDNWGGV